MALLTPVLPHFQLEGELVSASQIERGHINKTYETTIIEEGVPVRYIHQWINKHVFPDPPRLMDNISRVVQHLLDKRGSSPFELRLIRSEDGLPYYTDRVGEYWRTYYYVENSSVYDIVTEPAIAYEAALTFGKFLNDLSDLEASQLHVTLPNFHNTPWRVERLRAAEEKADHDRLSAASELRAEANRLEHLAPRLQRIVDQYPDTLRVTHNDTKVNNVLFHHKTGKGLCVIDLDTVMPGTVLFDIGDLIRTATNTGAEDARDLSTVDFDLERYDAILQGFSEELGSTLHEEEWRALPYAGAVLTYQCGVRFLTDYLDGDRYFHISYPDHNLVRAKCQFHLANQMLGRIEDATTLAAKYQSQC